LQQILHALFQRQTCRVSGKLAAQLVEFFRVEARVVQLPAQRRD
jgi:hypothetical protein